MIKTFILRLPYEESMEVLSEINYFLKHEEIIIPEYPDRSVFFRLTFTDEELTFMKLAHPDEYKIITS